MKKPKPRKAGPPCIYCESVEPRVGREHVIPQGLGTFEQNWTLPDVCDACNSRFGRELDLHLTRDSLEAYLRLDLSLKPASAASKLLDRRMKGTLRASGPLHGSRIRIQPTQDGDGLIPVPVAQVGFRRPGEEWTFLVERELSKERVAAVSAGGQLEVRVIAEAGDAERLRSKLEDLGVSFVLTEQHLDIGIPEGAIQVALDFLVDKTILRAVAKIAFNYTAKVVGATAVRRGEFDRIREFIKTGAEREPLVSANQWSPLIGVEATQSRAHVCGISWVPEYNSLIALVCLFNEVSYGVSLARGNMDEWSDVGKQHMFDPFLRKITEVPLAE
jgi:hypothetical protein